MPEQLRRVRFSDERIVADWLVGARAADVTASARSVEMDTHKMNATRTYGKSDARADDERLAHCQATPHTLSPGDPRGLLGVGLKAVRHRAIEFPWEQI